MKPELMPPSGSHLTRPPFILRFSPSSVHAKSGRMQERPGTPVLVMHDLACRSSAFTGRSLNSGTVPSHNRQRRCVAKGVARLEADAKTGLLHSGKSSPRNWNHMPPQQAGAKTRQEQAPALQGAFTFRCGFCSDDNTCTEQSNAIHAIAAVILPEPPDHGRRCFRSPTLTLRGFWLRHGPWLNLWRPRARGTVWRRIDACELILIREFRRLDLLFSLIRHIGGRRLNGRL